MSRKSGVGSLGATLIHGRRLLKQTVRYPDGSAAEELTAEGGDWVFPAYSSIEQMVAFCAERGVPASDWPIFYGLWEGHADLGEIVSRCQRLRDSLPRVTESEATAVPWLSAVRAWLAQGEVFAVFE